MVQFKQEALMSNPGTSPFFEDCKDDIIQRVLDGFGRNQLAKLYNIKVTKARKWRDKALKIIESSSGNTIASLASSRQKLMDKNRICNKTVRETSRISNAVREYTDNLEAVLKTHRFSGLTTKHHTSSAGRGVGIIHLTDLHFNELVDLAHNKYNFRVASSRLKLMAEESMAFLKAYDVKEVVIVMTGDMMNSDRRLDELLSQACNRSRATFIAVDILQQFIRHINVKYNVSVVCVTGNESRSTDEVGWSHEVASDNYDFTIFNILKLLFSNSSGIHFHSGDDPVEQTITINGLTFLLMHGNGSIAKDVEQSVTKVIGRYAAKNVMVNYVLFGHMHSARIGDVYSRGSSLVGSNAYSEYGLNLFGRASQNLYIVTGDRRIHGIKLDLQITDESRGYNIEKSLEAYNAKSASKLVTRQTVFEVKI